jgi:GGDEF domain-containing protein
MDTKFRSVHAGDVAIAPQGDSRPWPARAVSSDWADLIARESMSSLADRLTFQEAVRDRLAAGRPCALLLFEIEGLSKLQGRYGIENGSLLLDRIVNRLRFVEPLPLTVIRTGEDRFAVLIGLAGSDEAGSSALRFILALESAFISGNSAACHSISIGVAHSLSDTDNPTAMMRAATQALCVAKVAGGNVWRLANRVPEQTVQAGQTERGTVDGQIENPLAVSRKAPATSVLADVRDSSGGVIRSAHVLLSALAKIASFIGQTPVAYAGLYRAACTMSSRLFP